MLLKVIYKSRVGKPQDPRTQNPYCPYIWSHLQSLLYVHHAFCPSSTPPVCVQYDRHRSRVRSTGNEAGMGSTRNSLGGQASGQAPGYPSKELLSFIYYMHSLHLHMTQTFHTHIILSSSFQLLCCLLCTGHILQNSFAIRSTCHPVIPHQQYAHSASLQIPCYSLSSYSTFFLEKHHNSFP